MRAAATLAVVVAGVVLGGCDRRAAIASCRDNLHGVWVTPDGARWMLLDNGGTLEGYPLFDDSVPSGAPRVIDLARGDQTSGSIKRRFMQRALTCDARAPFSITACSNDELQIVRGDVSPPLGFGPCTWGAQLPSRVETWRRE